MAYADNYDEEDDGSSFDNEYQDAVSDESNDYEDYGGAFSDEYGYDEVGGTGTIEGEEGDDEESDDESDDPSNDFAQFDDEDRYAMIKGKPDEDGESKDGESGDKKGDNQDENKNPNETLQEQSQNNEQTGDSPTAGRMTIERAKKIWGSAGNKNLEINSLKIEVNNTIRTLLGYAGVAVSLLEFSFYLQPFEAILNLGDTEKHTIIGPLLPIENILNNPLIKGPLEKIEHTGKTIKPEKPAK